MISIVIVNWNAGPLLERCLMSLVEHAVDCEIIVVDNASKDFSLNFASKIGPLSILLRNNENLGFAAGNNLGWRSSKGDQVLFLNPDTECRPAAVSRLAQVLVEHPRYWAAGGRLVGLSGQPQSDFNVRVFPSIGSVAADMLLLDELRRANPWTRRYRSSNWNYDSTREVDQPAGACLMVQRWALERLGGFDESFHPAWFEDVDLCRRIHNNGGRIVFVHDALFLHHGGSSLKHLTREQFLEYFHTNQIRYFQKHHGMDTAGRIRRLICAGMYLRAGLSFFRPLISGTTRRSSARTFWRAARHFAGTQSIDDLRFTSDD